MPKIIIQVAALALNAFFIAATASAETYPSRPVRWIIPFPPGGGGDLVGRVIGQKLAASMGQPVIIDNRSGASATIGTDLIAKAAPDGYTIGLIISNHSVNPALFKKLPYDSIKDFAPITLIGYGLFILVVHPSVPAKSVQDLIALARSQPGKLNAGVPSTGTIGHLALEQLKSLYKVDLVHILYKGAGPAIIDLLGGHVQVVFSSFPSVQSFVKDGRLRALCVTSAKRSPVAPDLPTCHEAGAEGLVLSDWWGLVAPARTNKAIIARLNSEVVKALALPDIRERLQGVGGDLVGNTPEEFAAFLHAGQEKWGQVIRDAGIKAE